MAENASTALGTYVPQVKGQIRLRKIKPRYLGSVRFFKHVIICIVCIMLVTPWFIVGYLAGRSEARLTEVQLLETQLIRTVGELKSFIGEYETLVNQKNLADEEKLALMEDLKRAESLYVFESAYGDLHPELRVTGPTEYVDSTGVVYLTFDDGPGVNTRAVLDILKRYDIKATFFIVGYVINSPNREELLRRTVEEGHSIGVHTYSHIYKEVYNSLEDYMDDFAKASARIEEVSGVKPDIFRFPGGSVNSYNERWGNTIISEMLSRGYRYFDWNAGSGDTSEDATAESIYEAVIRQIHGNHYGVVLMHDGGGSRSRTVEALPMIIERLLREGYRFDKLTNQIKPTVYAPESLNRG